MQNLDKPTMLSYSSRMRPLAVLLGLLIAVQRWRSRSTPPRPEKRRRRRCKLTDSFWRETLLDDRVTFEYWCRIERKRFLALVQTIDGSEASEEALITATK